MALYNQGNKVGIGTVDLTEVNEKIDTIYDDGFASTKASFTTTNQMIDDSGAITESDSYRLTGYIKVNNDILYCYWNSLQKGNTDIYIRVAKYNSAKGFIKREIYLINPNEKYKIINTYNCEYVRLCYDYDVDGHFGKFNDFSVMDSMSNISLTEEISRRELELAELKMLGWNVPKVCPIQNEVNGNQFIQRVGRVDLGTLDWRYYEDSKRFLANHSNIKPTTDSNIVPNMVCAKYKTIALSGLNSSTKALAKENSNDGKFFIKDNEYTDADAFKTAIKGEYLYYELATPITKTIDGNENPNIVGSKLERFVAPATDAEVLALPNGIYSINVADVGTSLFPNSWGTLVVLKSGFVYGTMLYIGANAKMYFRNINNGAWREASWTELN